MGGGSLSDHKLIVIPSFFMWVYAHGYISLLELSDDIVELRGQDEVCFGLGFFAKEEKKHESL